MKSTFTFLLFLNLILSLPSRSQVIDSIRVKDMWNTDGYDDTPSLQYVDSFSSGLIRSTLFRTWNNHHWNNHSLTSYNYDGLNNLLVVTVQRFDSGNWIDKSRTLHTYDGSNRKTASLEQSFENYQWITQRSMTYNFDINGDLTITTYAYSPGLIDTCA